MACTQQSDGNGEGAIAEGLDPLGAALSVDRVGVAHRLTITSAFARSSPARSHWPRSAAASYVLSR